MTEAAAVETSKESQIRSARRWKLIRALLPIAGLILMIIFFNYETNGRLLKHLPLAMSQVYVIMIASMGVFFIMTMGGLDFSQGSILGLSCIVVCAVSKYSIPLAILAGIATGAAIGAVNGYFYVRRKIKSFIVTICTMFLFRGLIKYLTTNSPVAGSPQLLMIDSTTFKVVCTAAVVAVGFVIFTFTKFGVYLKAIGAGEHVLVLDADIDVAVDFIQGGAAISVVAVQAESHLIAGDLDVSVADRQAGVGR